MATRGQFPNLPFENFFRINASPLGVLAVLNADRAVLHLNALLRQDLKLVKVGVGVTQRSRSLKPTRNDTDSFLKLSDTLQMQFCEMADAWLKCNKNLRAPEANALYKTISEFLKTNPPVLTPKVPTALSFHDDKFRGVDREISRQLGWLSLCLVASDWSGDLYRCRRCKKFFVRRRPAQTADPRCSRECRRSLVESKKKFRQRRRAHSLRVRVAQHAFNELAKRPRASRPANPELFVAVAVSSLLHLAKPITRWSISRWIHNGEIIVPWQSSKR